MLRTRKENERRAKQRFAIQLEVRYKLLENSLIVASGAGNTINMSSRGIAFSAEEQFKPGAFIELSISWPVLLDQNCPMRLIIFGRIVRTVLRKAICTVDKYEFRTQARAVQTAASVRSDSILQRWADGMRKETVKSGQASA